MQKTTCICTIFVLTFNHMVEYALSLDIVFGSLADATRRDILQRISQTELTVSEVAEPYSISLAAVSKHLKVLEKANLIIRRRKGKEHMVTLSPYALKNADEYLEQYRRMWEQRYNKLDVLLNEGA